MTPTKQVVYIPAKEETEIGYFFTPEQLNQFISNIIKDTLDTAAEKVELVTESHWSGEGENSYVDRQSITDTFEETYKKHII